MNTKLVLLGAVLFSLLLFGCVNPPKGSEGQNGTTGTTGTQTGENTAGGSGGEIVDVGGTTSGGMSDPSKCNNLPPQEMADCLDKAMGD